MNRALIDYFRCPEGLVDLALRGDLCPGEGFFRFGPDVVCYGQSSLGYYADTPSKATCDLAYHVRTEGTTCYIPFDPTALVENLRRERYLGRNSNFGGEEEQTSLVRKAYSRLRPCLDVPIRRRLQRLRLRGREKTYFPSWPVDRTVDQLLEKVLALAIKARRLERIPFIWFWPDGQKSCAILTHEVEESAGFDSCLPLMDMADSFGIKSSFQFIPEKRDAVSRALLDRIRVRGFEASFHDLRHDGHLYDRRETGLSCICSNNEDMKECSALEFRFGALYRRLDRCDADELSYDMSVPNVGHLDHQGGGCCTVMPYFIGNVLELPVTTQDDTRLDMFSDDSLDLWQRESRLITDNHGLLSFITHPDFILEDRARETYVGLLAHLSRLRRQREVWMTLPAEVDRWWRERDSMTIVGEAGGWRIEGPGRERARLAYACLAGDRITYTFEPSSAETPLALAAAA
jgi:hypothetical protein